MASTAPSRRYPGTAASAASLGFYKHRSRGERLRDELRGVRAAAGRTGAVPVLYYLAGLTCTEETFIIKAGRSSVRPRHGLMLVAPDTSPRSPASR